MGALASKSRAKLAQASINAFPRLPAQAPAFESGRLVRARAMDARPRQSISVERQIPPHHSDGQGSETRIEEQGRRSPCEIRVRH